MSWNQRGAAIPLTVHSPGLGQRRHFGAKRLCQAKQLSLAAEFLGAEECINQRCRLHDKGADPPPSTIDQQKVAEFRL
jgi:hypothetical protein